MVISARRTQTNVDVDPVRQLRVREQDVSSGLQNVARGLDQVGDVVSQEAVRRKIEDDDAAVFDAFNQAQLGHEARFNGENGFNTLQGKESFNALGEASKYLNDSKNEVSKMLANDSQREKFQVLMDKDASVRLSGLTRHTENERVKYRDNVLNTTVTNEYGRAINNPGDDEIREDALFNAEIALQEKFKGQSQEFIQGKLKELRQGMNQEILLQLVETDFEQAQDYLNANYDDVKTSTKNTIEAKIKKKKHDLKVFSKTDEIINKYADEGSALLAAQKIQDPDTRKEVTGNLTNHYSNQRRVQLQRDTQALNDDWNNLIAYNDNNDVDAVNQMINSQGNAKTQLAMRNYIAKTNTGKASQTDAGTYSAALEVARDRPDELQLFIDENRDTLSLADYKKFADIANDNIENKDKAVKSAISENQQIKSVLQEHKFDLGAKASADEIARYNNFMQQYEESKNDWSKANGDRVPNFTERDKIVRRLLAEHVTEKSNWWFTSDDVSPYFELPADEQAAVDQAEVNQGFYNMSANQLMQLTPDQLSQLNTTGVSMSVITPAQQNALAKQATKLGLTATEENIKALYITYLKGRTR